jgi:hypothetical protein
MEASRCIMGCQLITIRLVIFKKLTRVDVKHPPQTFEVSNKDWIALQIFLNPTETCCSPRPPSKKILPLHS